MNMQVGVLNFVCAYYVDNLWKIISGSIDLMQWLVLPEKRLKWRKKLGLRDDSKYKMKAGDGANQKYARQG